MSREDKALQLCREYDRLMERIKDLKTQIGNALGQCPVAVKAGPYAPVDGIETHLKQAYASFDDDQGQPWKTRMWLDEDEQKEILAECSHCSIAHTHIQDRKAARKALGIVKRQIRMIGRSA